mmetsp:Transcript_36775/g.74927  ORF Transcript_36775/g.74927 Transcript_36775/m.74927 type:complete len:268 (+) Transcript_36775:634-1437(+)
MKRNRSRIGFRALDRPSIVLLHATAALFLAYSYLLLASIPRTCDSFAPSQLPSLVTSHAFGDRFYWPHHAASLPRPVPSTRLFAATSNEVDKMRAGEIRKELESYGISTKSFFEKSELVDALEKARAEGKTPIASSTSTSTSTASTSGTSASSTDTSTAGKKKKKKVRNESTEDTGTTATSTANREERLAEEILKCKAMKASELKAELQSLGVSTKSFFEKSEFVKALAEARVDGVKKTSAAGGAGSVDSEGYAEYKAADVEGTFTA